MGRLKLFDSAGDTTISTGTGPLVGLGVTPGTDWQLPTTAGVVNGDDTIIRIVDGSQWEDTETNITVAIGVLTYSRGTLIASSNNNTRVSFSAGTANIYFVAPKEVLTQEVLTLSGDTVYHDGRKIQSLAIGSNRQFLSSNGTYPTWSSISASDLSFTGDVSANGNFLSVNYLKNLSIAAGLSSSTGANYALVYDTTNKNLTLSAQTSAVTVPKLEVTTVTGAHYSILRDNTQNTGRALAASTLYAVPITIYQSMTLVGMSVWVGTGVASSKVRIGLYTELNGKPNTLVCDSGDLVTTASSTIVQGAVTATLSAGIYWAVAQSFTAASNIIAIQNNNSAHGLAWSRVIGSATVAQSTNYYVDSNTYGALSATYQIANPTLTNIGANTLPMMMTLDT